MIEFKRLPQIYYKVDVWLTDVTHHLNRWAESQVAFGYRLELNPDFQRGHVWTDTQKSAFVEWLLKGGTTTDIIFNHPEWQRSYEADMVCVDGLQRLTAVCEFMDGKITAFGHYVDDFSKLQLREATILKFAVGTLPHKECLELYVALNEGGTVHTNAEIEKVKQMIDLM